MRQILVLWGLVLWAQNYHSTAWEWLAYNTASTARGVLPNIPIPNPPYAAYAQKVIVGDSLIWVTGTFRQGNLNLHLPQSDGTSQNLGSAGNQSYAYVAAYNRKGFVSWAALIKGNRDVFSTDIAVVEGTLVWLGYGNVNNLTYEVRSGGSSSSSPVFGSPSPSDTNTFILRIQASSGALLGAQYIYGQTDEFPGIFTYHPSIPRQVFVGDDTVFVATTVNWDAVLLGALGGKYQLWVGGEKVYQRGFNISTTIGPTAQAFFVKLALSTLAPTEVYASTGMVTSCPPGPCEMASSYARGCISKNGVDYMLVYLEGNAFLQRWKKSGSSWSSTNIGSGLLNPSNIPGYSLWLLGVKGGSIDSIPLHKQASDGITHVQVKGRADTLYIALKGESGQWRSGHDFSSQKRIAVAKFALSSTPPYFSLQSEAMIGAGTTYVRGLDVDARGRPFLVGRQGESGFVLGLSSNLTDTIFSLQVRDRGASSKFHLEGMGLDSLGHFYLSGYYVDSGWVHKVYPTGRDSVLQSSAVGREMFFLGKLNWYRLGLSGMATSQNVAFPNRHMLGGGAQGRILGLLPPQSRIGLFAVPAQMKLSDVHITTLAPVSLGDWSFKKLPAGGRDTTLTLRQLHSNAELRPGQYYLVAASLSLGVFTDLLDTVRLVQQGSPVVHYQPPDTTRYMLSYYGWSEYPGQDILSASGPLYRREIKPLTNSSIVSATCVPAEVVNTTEKVYLAIRGSGSPPDSVYILQGELHTGLWRVAGRYKHRPSTVVSGDLGPIEKGYAYLPTYLRYNPYTGGLYGVGGDWLEGRGGVQLYLPIGSQLTQVNLLDPQTKFPFGGAPHNPRGFSTRRHRLAFKDVAFDPRGYHFYAVYAPGALSDAIVRHTPDDSLIFVAGGKLPPGTADGTGSQAKFQTIWAIGLERDTLWILDMIVQGGQSYLRLRKGVSTNLNDIKAPLAVTSVDTLGPIAFPQEVYWDFVRRRIMIRSHSWGFPVWSYDLSKRRLRKLLGGGWAIYSFNLDTLSDGPTSFAVPLKGGSILVGDDIGNLRLAMPVYCSEQGQERYLAHQGLAGASTSRAGASLSQVNDTITFSLASFAQLGRDSFYVTATRSGLANFPRDSALLHVYRIKKVRPFRYLPDTMCAGQWIYVEAGDTVYYEGPAHAKENIYGVVPVALSGEFVGLSVIRPTVADEYASLSLSVDPRYGPFRCALGGSDSVYVRRGHVVRLWALQEAKFGGNWQQLRRTPHHLKDILSDSCEAPIGQFWGFYTMGECSFWQTLGLSGAQVDVVKIELRESPTGPAVDSLLGIVDTTGKIWAWYQRFPEEMLLNGDTLRFCRCDLTTSKYIVVRSNNHLPVMTMQALSLSTQTETPSEVDMTDPSLLWGEAGVDYTILYRGNQARAAMWAGNVSDLAYPWMQGFDRGVINAADWEEVLKYNGISGSGLYPADLDGDGTVNAMDYTIVEEAMQLQRQVSFE